ncbi:hypothetical protein NEOLEDRAFT_1154840 [Neolentinus lepideus HHB14362 ss-1]|uniref:Rho-GAP domain-containing protein n=1 Tax=Neolentinus lepideus HHB14362 ss-1 TaxID=1314782 RepID=A0A165UAH2_9AGAM|nr:hypothetical protein NEOLEDRAFT_1154840 [Neolentinus lepideus HHB14362 ss-1]
MAVLSLPLSFNNSFWSQDYRRGLEVLYGKLQQGVAENEEIVAFIRARANAEAALAESLMVPMPTGNKGTGFDADDGASLLMAYRGLQSESVAQGKVHEGIAKELDTLVADPFEDWAKGYKERLRQNRTTVVDGWLRSYEHAQAEVLKLKNSYLSKMRRADEAEDDARFAPTNEYQDKYTTSPRLGPRDPHRTPPLRTASVSERIAQRLKEIQRRSAGKAEIRQESTFVNASESANKEKGGASRENDEQPLIPKVDKGKGKEVDPEQVTASPPQIASPPPLSPPLPPSQLPSEIHIPPPSSPMPPPPPSPIILAGLSLPPSAISGLLTRAAASMPLRPVRFPILGEYPDCFTGDEFITWLTDNVEGFGGSLDKAEDAARVLTESEGLLRRIGEFGNTFEASDEAFYQFRPKAFELGATPQQQTKSPISSPASTTRNLAPIAEGLVKRSENFVHLVQRALNANANGAVEPPFVKLRKDAETADKEYRIAVRKLDRQRLGLEERIEDTLKLLQRWEGDRLRAVKTALLQYEGTLSNTPKALESSLERSATLIAAYQPESDLNALIERYRTGPFRPHPQIYESVSRDESDVVFGIDLRKWAEGGWDILHSGEEKKDSDLVPPVLSAMLRGLGESYTKLPNDAEKRKAWIYEVPLVAVHHLRESLNAVLPDQPFPEELFKNYDVPVIASCVKLWMLELDPPLGLWEGWDEFRKIYPTVGKSTKEDGEVSPEQHMQELQGALLRLPRVHLYVLDAIVAHLRNLIDSTTTEESNEVYITKLALTMGRTVLRPKFETEISVQDRHPTLLFMDLVNHYSEILPQTIVKKKRESERKIPLRKRTAPIDMRTSRSRISVSASAGGLLAVQERAKKQGEPLPPVPAVENSPAPPPVLEPESKPAALESVAPTASETSNDNASTNTTETRATTVEDSDVPPRPAFKEPPPEDDDLPPRPNFKEPSPEDDEVPPRPNFAEPPPEDEEKVPSSTVIDATSPTKAASPQIPSPASGTRTPSQTSRATSPEDQSLTSGKVSLSRTTSNDASRVRGPRMSRGPRVQGGSVSSIVSNLNRNSVAGSPTSPGFKPRSPASPSRPSSVVNDRRSSVRRSGAFSRRTMASDAEEDLQK